MHNEIINKIRNRGIKVKDQQKIIKYINKYGYYRMIDCYGEYFKKLSPKKCNTNDIIKIFEFDKKIANLLANYIFDFEQQLNTIAIDEICSYNNLNDDYVLTITNNPAYSNLRNKGFADFTNEIYDGCKSCNLIKEDINPKSLPLKILSVSWSFHTLISFIFLQDEQVISNISKRFNLHESSHSYFISACHSIRKFRNILSHNGFFLISQLNFYRREFNQIININLNKNYDLDTNITIYKLTILLEKLLMTSIIDGEFKKLIKQLRLTKKQKNDLLKDIGF